MAEAVGYPDKVPADASSFVFRVDGAEVKAFSLEGAVRLVYEIDADEDDLPTLADWAVGRMMREEAVLAAASSGKPFLWREISAKADDAELRRFFETFLDSCDWWRARMDERKSGGAPRFPSVMIRP